MRKLLCIFLLLLLPLAADPISHDLEALTPEITKKKTLIMRTDLGDVEIEVYPEAAPNAANRFLDLAVRNFYDDTPVSRVVDDFVAQFGINWREPYRNWKEVTFKDDRSHFRLERGTICFAKAGPDTNSTQVFINLKDNSFLVGMEFAVFGKVTKGMDVVERFARCGDASGGLDQGRLWRDGESYLKSLKKKPTMIRSITLWEDPKPEN